MSDEFDPFQLSTGLPDSLDTYIENAWFEFDPAYNDGQTLVLKFQVRTNDEDFGEAGVGEILYPCGTGWEAAENGAWAVREDGNERKGFNRQSRYGLFISKAIDCDGAEKVMRAEGRGDPRMAAMWVDTTWHLERVEHDYKGEIGKIPMLLPDKFLGEGNHVGGGGAPVAAKKAAGPVKKAAAKVAGAVKKAGPAPAPTAKKAGPRPVKAAAKKLPAPTAELPEEPAEGMTQEQYQQLYDLAMTCETHETFIERAYSEVEWVTGNGSAEAAVLAGEGEESVWAKAVADYEAANS